MTLKRQKFPFYKQYDRTDCGPTCLRMMAKYYGKIYSPEYLRELCNITTEGVYRGSLVFAVVNSILVIFEFIGAMRGIEIIADEKE